MSLYRMVGGQTCYSLTVGGKESDTFPPEIWDQVMKWLPDQDISAWCLTCKLFKELFRHWKSWHFFKTFGHCMNNQRTYHSFYFYSEQVTFRDGLVRIISMLSTPCIFGIDFELDYYSSSHRVIRFVAYKLMAIFKFHKVSFKENFMKHFMNNDESIVFIGVTDAGVKTMTRKKQSKKHEAHINVAIKTSMPRYKFRISANSDGSVKILCDHICSRPLSASDGLGKIWKGSLT